MTTKLSDMTAQRAEEEDDEEETDDFYDAIEEMSITEERSKESLEAHMEEVLNIFYLYLNNNFDEAEKILEKSVNKSMYHSLGRGTLATFQAVMTFQYSDIEEGLRRLKVCGQTCDKERRRMNFMQNKSKLFSKLSPYEVHAELCYAECLLEQAFLTFIQDDNFSSFIKGALKVKTCLSTYKTSVDIMRKREWQEDKHKMHFESGICLGVGAFNLMVSLLPPKIVKVLEFVGFKASKEKGLQELQKGAAMTESLRGPVCSILLVMYHTFIDYIFGLGEGDLELSGSLLDQLLLKCPNSAIFIFLHGRLLEVSGKINQAISRLEESIASQGQWKQFHHFCYWELMWCHAYECDWLLAMKYAEILYRESKWSRTVCAFNAGVFMLMMVDTMDGLGDEKDSQQRNKMLQHVNAMFAEVPRWKQRIAGKSVPVEKWCVRKVESFKSQPLSLVLPAYELFFIWNGFEVVHKLPGKLDNILANVDKKIKTYTLLEGNNSTTTLHDNLALLHLIKGMCLRRSHKHSQAISAFNHVLTLEGSIKNDTYLIPSCLYELGLTFLDANDKVQAAKYLDKAKCNYTGYQLESRISSKIQAGLRKVRDPGPNVDIMDQVQKAL